MSSYIIQVCILNRSGGIEIEGESAVFLGIVFLFSLVLSAVIGHSRRTLRYCTTYIPQSSSGVAFAAHIRTHNLYPIYNMSPLFLSYPLSTMSHSSKKCVTSYFIMVDLVFSD